MMQNTLSHILLAIESKRFQLQVQTSNIELRIHKNNLKMHNFYKNHTSLDRRKDTRPVKFSSLFNADISPLMDVRV